MTVVVASTAPEGIVLASDSRMTQERGDHHRVASDASQKIFDAWGRFGVATYGIAMIGQRSLAGLINARLSEPDAGNDLRRVAEELAGHLQGCLDAATPARRGPEPYDPAWPLGVLIAGYDKCGSGRVLEAQIWPRTQKVIELDVSTDEPSSLWRGQTSAIRRLINGVDLIELRKVGVPMDDETRERMKTMGYDLIQPATVQDAVDLAHFVVETTVQMQRFSDGTYAAPKQIPGCGGPTQCVAVTPAGVRWISRLTLTAPDRRRRDDRD